jgi:hypothetical protein
MRVEQNSVIDIKMVSQTSGSNADELHHWFPTIDSGNSSNSCSSSPATDHNTHKSPIHQVSESMSIDTDIAVGNSDSLVKESEILTALITVKVSEECHNSTNSPSKNDLANPTNPVSMFSPTLNEKEINNVSIMRHL